VKTRFQAKFNIKKGDQVVVIAGNDKNLTTPRTVLAVMPDAQKPRVLVEGVRMVTKHKKPNAQSPQGTITNCFKQCNALGCEGWSRYKSENRKK
jgi:large subunit ribosomal protein L24